MKTITFFAALLLLLLSGVVSAQTETAHRRSTFQVTLFPPVGTNGTEGGNTINQFSLNIFAGYAAGLNGLEFGGFLNINRDFMEGVQFSGFANITGGPVHGAQFANFANFNSADSEVAQFAGFANFNNGTTDGFQGAGFANFTRGYSNAFQVAGFGNFSHDLHGAQLAGFGNFASGKVEGAQLAGFGNFAEDVEGAQISGFINVAKHVKGVQLGVINVADSVSNGVPIGFLSIVKNGFYEFEIGGSEGLNGYASFKIGVNQFYNIFSAGMQFAGDEFRWGYGYGIGTHLMKDKGFKINLEAMSYQIMEERWSDEYNGLQQLKLTFDKSLGEHVGIFAGPSFNLLVSHDSNNDGVNPVSDFPPYHMAKWENGRSTLKTWIGFNAGIRIR